ncbi:glycosyltransferase family 2 protein [Maribacter sp. 2210JD10-5]|uniref:glycosyltransferase family 2 protein n=1 Tax=Maribacter sp. 2210JD10-5 TaxID=3386272 RepID=UPI0039BD5916
MNRPLVSILIPFKNTQDYLLECLKSIANQQYKHWEVIAVNDGSTDKSLEIAKKFALQDPRFKVLNNTGKGIIEALRMAYKQADGTLITRMDSDDIMTPDKISVMVNSLLDHGKGHIAIGQVKYFSEKGINNGYERYEHWLNELTEKGNNYAEIYKECVIPSPCWMVFKEDLDLCDVFNPNRYPEDYDLAFRFYKNSLKCIPCDTVLHYWRDYDSRTSRTSEHYAQNYFLDIKLHYFLALDYNPEKPLVLWGAGKKGKEIAKKLVEKNIPFHWICDNPKKIGKEIYGKEMLPFTILKTIKNPQTIITVANEAEQKEIQNYFHSLEQVPAKDYFFFC